MAETGFDLRSGELLIGAAGIEQRTIEAGPDVVPLPELLTAEEFPIHPDTYKRLDTSDWGPEEYRQWGEWVVSLLANAREPQPLRRRHTERMEALGLGPTRTRLGNLTVFRAGLEGAAALEPERQRRQPRHPAPKFYLWPNEQFIRHATAVEKRAGRRPRAEDYRAATSPTRPGLSAIRERFGTVAALNEYLGYPDYSIWEPEDFIQYGIYFIKANGYDPSCLVAHLFEVPARKERGPWANTPLRLFGSWATYKEKVLQAYQDERLYKTTRYRNHINTGVLPRAFAELPDAELDQAAARYLVISDLARTIAPSTRSRLAMELSTASLVRTLRKHNNTITEGDIERSAVTYDVFDDLWPPAYVSHLTITAEERAAAHKRMRASWRNNKQSSPTAVGAE